jgi:hypothetical protein
MRRRATRPLWLLAAALPLLVGTPVAAQQAGKYGLWVSFEGDSVAVHWLTDSATAGALEVIHRGETVLRTATPAAVAHRASFAAAGRDTVQLRFGTAGDNGLEHVVQVGLRPPTRPHAIHEQPDSLFVLGDTHGAFDVLIAGLQVAGVIDSSLAWSAGRSHVVFAGDMTDRGPDVIRLLWFIYGLEQQAAAAGGRVHVLLGNHEIMVLLADLRYVHPKELAIAELHGVRYDELFNRHTSLLGRWLASRPGVVRIGDVVVAHGGVTPEYARLSIPELNDTLAHYLHTALLVDDTITVVTDTVAEQARFDFFWGERSLFWHRDYVRADSLDADIKETLQRWSARTMVVGHTAVQRIDEMHGGHLIAAHTPRLGGELLLLVRRGQHLDRFRISAANGAQRF